MVEKLSNDERERLLESLFDGHQMNSSELFTLIGENLGREIAPYIRYRLEELGETVPRTLDANAKRTEDKTFKKDLIEITIETTDLNAFRFSNGRLNIRSLARHIQGKLNCRNQNLSSQQRPARRLGLRTIENAVKNWLYEESENSRN